MSIHHIATGGTLDSIWSPERDTAVPASRSSVQDYMTQTARLTGVTSETLFLKDSREITVADKEGVVNAVSESANRRVIVTCGTYLMTDIGRRIAKHHAHDIQGKKIILTGSIIPLSGFEASDGGFNLGVAYSVLHNPEMPTVTLTMNGRVFDAIEAEKDLTSATFNSDTGQDLLRYRTVMLIPMGGSIDFDYDGQDGLTQSTETFIPGYLRKNVKTDRQIRSSMPVLKDSREITQEEIDTAIDMINMGTSDRVILTTGLYKMTDIATKIEQAMDGKKESKPTVLITGSRLPLKTSRPSDAPFNLGHTFGEASHLQPGVHICVNGRTVSADTNILPIVYTPEELKKVKF